MKCFGNIDKMLECICNWCKVVLDFIICSIFIVGFFGEIDVEFGELLDFLCEVELDCVGVFIYFLVDGVKVNELFDLVFEEFKEDCFE